MSGKKYENNLEVICVVVARDPRPNDPWTPAE
jgi:hypothetical protein